GIENHVAKARGHVVQPVHVDQRLKLRLLQTFIVSQAKQEKPGCARYRA
ncbi:hypothetical protein chiPu_0029978, partial [Chiloscyllium punctatum]|nr:hypothetical protein [Chiloscyllium punctatum]